MTELSVRFKTQKEIDRDLLNEGLRERGYWPEVPYPANIYIAELAGLPIKDIPASEGFEVTGYWKFVYLENADGSRTRVIIQGKHARIFVAYTPEQAEIIARHWHLISDEAKAPEYRYTEFDFEEIV